MKMRNGVGNEGRNEEERHEGRRIKLRVHTTYNLNKQNCSFTGYEWTWIRLAWPSSLLPLIRQNLLHKLVWSRSISLPTPLSRYVSSWHSSLLGGKGCRHTKHLFTYFFRYSQRIWWLPGEIMILSIGKWEGRRRKHHMYVLFQTLHGRSSLRYSMSASVIR